MYAISKHSAMYSIFYNYIVYNMLLHKIYINHDFLELFLCVNWKIEKQILRVFLSNWMKKKYQEQN